MFKNNSVPRENILTHVDYSIIIAIVIVVIIAALTAQQKGNATPKQHTLESPQAAAPQSSAKPR